MSAGIDQHIYDEIPRLLTGEADRSVVHGAAAHLRQCEDCTEELISAVVAHASLASAVRYAPEVVTGFVAEPTVAEPETGREALPDLSAVFAQVREEAGQQSATGPRDTTEGRPRRSGVGRRLAVAAAVAGLAVGAGGAYAAQHVHSTGGRTVAMGAYGIGHTDATATVRGDQQIQLNASSLPAPAPGEYYEVWLTDAARQHMAPVGPLDPKGKGTFEVSSSLVDTYSAIEVSVQSAESTGAYSGLSVLRGSYR
jgi:hypothetical protein